MTDDGQWGSPKPTDDDGPEAAFDRALRAAIREDAAEARREAAETGARDPWYVPEPECPECGHSPCLRCDPCVERRREAGLRRLARAVLAYAEKQKAKEAGE